MNSKTILALLILVAVSLASAAQAGSLSIPAGYACVDTVVNMPAGAYFGGFDILPNGNFVVSDGHTVREITRGGEDVRTLHTYADAVYASFVRYNASNGRVYFGESMNNTIMSVAASGGTASLLATLTGNYDIDFWNGNPYVVAGNSVYLIDESTGETDLIASAGLISGPLAFDAAGNLVYGTGNPNWPPTLNDQDIYQWTAAQVAGAAGEGSLTDADAAVIASNVDAPSGFAFNSAGELLFTDSQVAPGVIRVLRGGAGEVFATTQPADAYPWTTTLRCDRSSGSISAAVSWFDASWNGHTVISTLTPVPEPSSMVVLCSFIGLAGSARLLLHRRK